MNIREQSEELERKYLSPYASLSCESQGRERKKNNAILERFIRETETVLYTARHLEE